MNVADDMTISPAPPTYRRPASVLVVVFTLAGEFLLMRRTRPADFWQSVTGSLNCGETPRLAALRELREETGLLGGAQLMDLHQTRLFPILRPWRTRYRAGHCFNREYWFALGLSRRRFIRLNAVEHSEYQWLRLSDALERATSWTNREAIGLLAGVQVVW